MKINTTFSTLAIYLLTFLMTTDNAFATPAPPMAGGYYEVQVNQEVKAAALFAVQTQTKRENKPLELIEISKATQQVVAGMNYQFELSIKIDGKIAKAKVIVFQSLENTYELTSWQWQPSAK